MTDEKTGSESSPTESSAVPPLAPGRGAPIVPGAPMSVGPPIAARTINTAALLWVVVAVVVVIVLIMVVASRLVPR